MNSKVKLTLLIISTVVGTVFFEHIARVNDVQFKPSVFVRRLSTVSENIFQIIGEHFAHISSYITVLKIKELFITTYDLLKPTVHLVLSPFYMIDAFIEEAHEYKYPIMIAIGSGLLLSLAISVLYRQKIMEFIKDFRNIKKQLKRELKEKKVEEFSVFM